METTFTVPSDHTANKSDVLCLHFGLVFQCLKILKSRFTGGAKLHYIRNLVFCKLQIKMK